MSGVGYIARTLEETLVLRRKQFCALAITGPRQSGKSTMLRRLFGRRLRYVSMDQPSNIERAQKDPELFLHELGAPVVLDEIQYAPFLMPVIRERIDRERWRRGRYILSGSQQFQVMRGLTETLAGRIAPLTLLPFDRFEWPRPGRADVNERKLFVDRSLRGSYPEVVAMKPDAVAAWYEAYIQTYLERDVRNINNIGNLRDFRRFLTLAAGRVGQIFNMSTFASELGVSVPTIKSWTSILEASYVVFLLPPYHRNFGRRVLKSPKLYFHDVGLAAHLAGIAHESVLLNGPWSGAFFENFVLQEILRAHHHHGLRPDISYWRSASGIEVDFLVEAQAKLWTIECKFAGAPRPGHADQIEKLIAIAEGSLPIHAAVVAPSAENEALTRRVQAMSIADLLEALIRGRR